MVYLNDEIFDWIERHLDDDPKSLALKYSGKADWIPFAVTQIECRKRSSKKLSETLKNRRFVFPSLLSAEQSTSDLVASFHASLISGCSSVLDLTCGLCIDAFHIAESAKSVTAIDINPSAVECARHNATILGIDNIDVVCKDCAQFLQAHNDKYDVVFIDPARRSSSGGRVYALSDCQPDVVKLMPLIKREAKRLIIKMSPMLDPQQIIKELPNIKRLYSIGTSNECKELVAEIIFDEANDDIELQAVTMQGSYDEGGEKMTFYLNDEISSSLTYQTPLPGNFLYVPYPSVSKLMPFKLLSERFGIGKLAVNSHIYASPVYTEQFPGHIYNIESVVPFTKAEIKKFSAQYPQINIATRNFMLSPEELRKRLKTKDGGNHYLFATTLQDSNKVLIVCTRRK